jgi:hypothetical protein
MPRGSHRPEQADSGVEAATAHLIRGGIIGNQWSSVVIDSGVEAATAHRTNCAAD